ncbi:MAG: hypothetical protein JWQ71_1460 [Pedosphaera sp.]|nr:hypothetical protein [Pedosphaera sp.]
MRRDILFLVRGIPEDRRLHARHFFMAKPSNVFNRQIFELAKILPELRHFIEERPEENLICAGFRNEHKGESETIEKAWSALGNIIDGFAFTIDGRLPEVCPVILVRESDAPHAKVMTYRSGGWAHFHPNTPDSAAKWQERELKLFGRLLTFFDIVAGGDPKYKNDLGFQVGYSAKMFRCGGQAKNFGVEYLCKFSALEGLVCGAEKEGKEKLLKERLARLFAKSPRDVKKDVKRLWKLRCEASHQAKAFYDEEIPDSNQLQTETVLIEYFLTGVLVFALDQVENAKSVAELWTMLPGYTLPDYALFERPADMPKLPIMNMVRDTKLYWRDAGLLVDMVYKQFLPEPKGGK